MNKIRNSVASALAIGLIFFGLLIQANAQISRANTRQINDILRRLNVKVDDFRYGLDSEFSRGTTSRDDENEIKGYLNTLQDDLNNFQDKFDRRRESADDVSQILRSAKNVDDFVSRNSLNSKIQVDWASARTYLSQLASNYGLSWSGSSTQNPNNQYPDNNRTSNNNRYPGSTRNSSGNSFNAGLSGTYQLDTSKSDNIREIAQQAVNDIDTQKRDESRRDLEDKLEAPEYLAIEVRGNQITLASTRAPRLTFTADGQDRNETLPDGRTIRLRTTLRGQELIISSLGGDNDYTVTFTSVDNGRSLKVTRRITTEYLRQTIFADSVYNKTDSAARLDIYENPSNTTTASTNTTNYPGNNPPTTKSGSTGQFIVPNGTILTGNIENLISTKISQNNDRFRMTVIAPNQYRGALIEGYLSGIDRSGKVSGRSKVTFNFETIRLTNGNTYDFAGFLQSVTDTNGKTIKVDTEGTATGDNQTKETAKRGGIGAGIGALIGAIAGGGKGAAIGAIIGGGAGAGSVYVQGKDDLELPAGSTLTVQASAPAN
jgi:hypothetical protein